MSGSINRATRIVTLVASAALLTSVAVAQKVSSDYDRSIDFGHYHTFSIYRVHASDSLVEGRLRDNIAQSLSQHGWQQVPQGGDVAVTAIGEVKDQQEYSTFYNDLGPGWGYGGWRGGFGWGGWGGGPSTATTRSFTVPIGTLAIDLYDTKTHQLVFRGTAVDQLSHKSDKNIKKGEQAVDKIFDKLPKKHEG